jgi:toxin YoeB
MSYEIAYTKDAGKTVEKLKKSGSVRLREKLNDLLNEMREHPETGTGRPEQLRHYKTPTWSRRLSGQHRIIYEIHDNVLIVLVLDILGHYSDK